MASLSLRFARRGLAAARPSAMRMPAFAFSTSMASAQNYELPALNFEYDGLEPHMDEATVKVHYSGHHQTYCTNMNLALGKLAEVNEELAKAPLNDILKRLDEVPEDIRGPLSKALGGYVNHNLWWSLLAPGKGGAPSGAVADAIDASFGSFDAFKEQFTAASLGVFGSGWTWLIVDKTDGNALKIVTSANQETPAMEEGKVPILTLDVWEHAYYLKFQSKRPAFVETWWNLINWDEVNRLLSEA